MSDLSEFALGAPNVVLLHCLELSHPQFSQTYRVVTNTSDGVSVTHEGPAGPFAYTYVPGRVLQIPTRDDLEQSLQVSLGDLGDVLAAEIESVWLGNGLDTRPTLTYRRYRSDDLSAPLDGALVLELVNVMTTREGVTFEASAPEINASRTGELYSVQRFPMLRAFL